MKYLKEGLKTEELKSMFRMLAKKLHPDKPGGDKQQYQELQEEYQKCLRSTGFSEAEAEAEAGIYDKLKELAKKFQCDTVTIEVTGSWVWISGDTYPIKEALKDEGCRYSRSKKRWYYAPSLRHKKKRGTSFKKIKTKYGYKKEVIKREKKYITE